jgi:glyoxylate reductase
MNKIFVSAGYPGNSIDSLSDKYDVHVFDKDRLPTAEELARKAEGSSALITTVSDIVNKKIIDLCPDLKIISNSGVGYENVDIPYATEKGIFVTNTPGVLTETTADMAWVLILSVGRRIVEADAYVREGQFKCWLPSLMLGMNIHNKTLGVFGMGRIGTAVARRASGFNMNIIYNNRGRNELAEKDTGAVFVDFQTLLKESDYIVVTTPLTPETKGRFGLPEFRQMKSGAIIINIGRGPVIKEAELAEALKERLIWGAGLDVFENEPKVDPELLKQKNVVLAPHMASASWETREEMIAMAVRSVELALNGEVPEHLVNPQVVSSK